MSDTVEVRALRTIKDRGYHLAPKETAEVPVNVADAWFRFGYAEPVKKAARKKAAAKTAGGE